jgi:3-methyladenine DNA glycosylase/8-oxoguanine DNA glycosylase
MRVGDLLLRGASGEPVGFARTIVSHGVAELPPNRVDLEARTFETTLPDRSRRRTRRHAAGEALSATVAHMFRLDEDLSGFYTLVSEDGDLA